MQEQRVKGFVSVKPEGYIKPLGVTEITENGTYNVKEFEFANVNVAGNSESTLKKLLDYTKSAKYLFYQNEQITDLTGLIEYNDTENVTDISYMFAGCLNLTNIPLFDTRNVTSLIGTFEVCKGLKTIPLLNLSSATTVERLCYNCTGLTSVPQLDTSNVNIMSSMFQGCVNLTTIPQLDTSKATTMYNMFYNCSSLTSVPQLNTIYVTDMNGMFRGCKNLVKLPQIVTPNVNDMSVMCYDCNKLLFLDITFYNLSTTSKSASMFSYCYSLKAVVIREFGTHYTLHSNAFTNCYHMLGTTNSTYNPEGLQDGYIYVPRDMIAILEVASNWSTWATQLRALEDYTLDGTTTGELDLEKMGLGDLNE